MLAKDKKVEFIIPNIDWPLIISGLLLSIIGLVAIYSATLKTESPMTYLTKQSLSLMLGILFCVLLISINYQVLANFATYLYSFGVVLLISVLFWGVRIRGTRGWFNLGIFHFQPAEITKLFFIIALTSYLSVNWKNIFRLNKLITPLVLLGVYVGLILLQPDFSSALVYFPILVCMVYFAGANPIHIVYILLFGAISAGIPLLATYIRIKHPFLTKGPLWGNIFKASYDIYTAVIIVLIISAILLLLWWFIHKLKIKLPFIVVAGLIAVIFAGTLSSFGVSRSLKEYQRKRLMVFIDPKIDPLGAGYNIIQSKIAIGSGRIFGKGLFRGSQVGLGFIPEQHTDFIFSVIGEETGFLGSSFSLLVYIFFIWRVLIVMREAKDRVGSLIASGIAVMFMFYLFINVGMTLGLAPATGLPLPFISYGGSSLVASWSAIGILESIHSRRFTY